MALTPAGTQSPNDKRERREAAQEDALMREVDEAVLHDDLTTFLRKYGIAMLAVIVIALGSFGGYLWWNSHSEGVMERSSEDFVKALDQVEAGNLDTADSALDGVISEGGPGAAAVARLMKAGIALEDGRVEEATTAYDALAADETAPKAIRDIATIRSVAANFDTLDPQVVIDRLKPLAVPGSSFFGTSGELVAMAYIEQGKNDLAGALFAEISNDAAVPQDMQSRARQMAGLLGVDAITDVDQAIEAVTGEEGGEAALVE